MEGLNKIKDLQEFINDDDWGDSDDAENTQTATRVPKAKTYTPADPQPAQKNAPPQKKPAKTCKSCGREMRIIGRGLCGNCYNAEKEAGTLDKNYPRINRKDAKELITCAECSEKRPLLARGMCAACYNRINYHKNKAKPAAPTQRNTEIEKAKTTGAKRVEQAKENLRKNLDRKKEDRAQNLVGTAHQTQDKTATAAAQPQPAFVGALRQVLNEIETLLLQKNAAYGNSALEPVRVFSKADPVEQLRVRLDDKLSRLMRGHEMQGDDTETDLLGYLVMLKIAQKQQEDPR